MFEDKFMDIIFGEMLCNMKKKNLNQAISKEQVK